MLSARNLLPDARNLVLSARNLVLSARDLVLSTRDVVLSARSTILQCSIQLYSQKYVLTLSPSTLRIFFLVTKFKTLCLLDM